MKNFIILLTFFSFVIAQHEFFNIDHNEPFKISIENSAISERFHSSNYYSSNFLMSYDWFPLMMQLKVNANSFLEINLENSFYYLPNNIPAEYLEENSIRQNNYYLNYPFEIIAAYEYDLFSFYFKTSFITEEFTFNRITEYLEAENGPEFIYEKESLASQSLDNSFFISYKDNSNIFGIGFKNYLVNLNSDKLPYFYQPESYPYLSYEIEKESFFLVSQYESGLTYKLDISDEIDITPSLFYYSGDFERVNVNFKYDYKVNEQISLFTNFEFNKGTENSIFLKDVTRYLKSSRPDKYNQNSIISIGANYTFSDERKQYVPKVVSYNNTNSELFSYNKNAFLDSEFASLSLENSSNSNLNYRIFISSQSGYLSYESDVYVHSSNEEISIPLYLQFIKDLGPTDEINEKIFISIIRDNKRELLFEEDVIINGSLYWDGKISGLKVFAQANDVFLNRKIVEHTRKSFESSLKKIKYLTDFYGNDFEVVGPTKNDSKKRVQSPFMTFTQKKGNNEDLLVFFAYLFHKADIDNKLLAINQNDVSNQKTLLLINTGLKASELEQNDLNVTNSVIMEDNSGLPTVWIAFETQHLNLGFEKLLELSSQNYNSELLKNSNNDYKIYKSH